jgi:hypothetical protein
MTAGATLTIGTPDAGNVINIANEALGIHNATLSGNAAQLLGGRQVIVDLRALDWTAYGSWLSNQSNFQSSEDPTSYNAAFFTGYETPGSAVPTGGTATFSGWTQGSAWTDGSEGVIWDVLFGKAHLVVNFENRIITGSLTGMEVGDSWYAGASQWNSVSFLASFTSGQSRFSGTAAVMATPGVTLGDYLVLKDTATGSLVGSFFGPTANEAGAVWTLSDGTVWAVGALGAKKD